MFLATAWVVLQVLDVLIQNGMIPAWAFKTAVVLLLIGLPVVLATAFVQEGIVRRDPGPSGPGDAPAPGPAAERGRAAGEGAPRGAGHPSGPGAGPPGATERSAVHRLLTWRNAVLGGVAAFALLGMGAAGYMGMRTLGIGSPGTLLAQGVLER